MHDFTHAYSLHAASLVVQPHLQHSQFAMLPHPSSKLWLLLLHSICKVIAPAGAFVERPVCLIDEQK